MNMQRLKHALAGLALLLACGPGPALAESADLSLTKFDSADPVTVGDHLRYTLIVSNNGLDNASGVTVTDTLPATVAFVQDASTSICTHSGATPGGTVTCLVGPLPAGDGLGFPIVVKPTAPSSAIINWATVTSDTPDPMPGNNTDSETTTVNPADTDGDGIPDGRDNCREVSNPDQADSDGDGMGDICDIPPDSDRDGVIDTADNCPNIFNDDQANSDTDSFGNACDNCPNVANADQADGNNNNIGDACEQVIPKSLVLTPRKAVNPVGTSHTVTALVKGAAGQSAPAITVRFLVVKKPTVSGSCVTNASGQCGFTYQGPTVAATNVIGAHADTDNDKRLDRGEPVGAAIKQWVR